MVDGITAMNGLGNDVDDDLPTQKDGGEQPLEPEDQILGDERTALVISTACFDVLFLTADG